MVKLDTNYELNHVYTIAGQGATIEIGDGESFDDNTFELFEKSLALTSDLKRIPILRSIWGSWDFYLTGLGTAMQASSISQLKVRVVVYDDLVHEDNVLATYVMFIRQDSGTVVAITLDPIEWGLRGGRILSDKLVVRTELEGNAVAAGSAFDGSKFGATMNLEIDWFPITKGQLTEYLLEHMYVDKSPEAT